MAKYDVTRSGTTRRFQVTMQDGVNIIRCTVTVPAPKPTENRTDKQWKDEALKLAKALSAQLNDAIGEV